MKYLPLLLLILLFACQQPNSSTSVEELQITLEPKLEAVTLLGDSLFSEAPVSGKALDNYNTALEAYHQQPNDPEALIWLGRRTAYLGHFQEAIDIFTIGIKKHPEDARMYRHRGHRYISTRQYDKAIADFENAAQLIQGQTDETEPDGLPNERNIPLSTLHGNIWYHLGLAYYLQDNLPKALNAFGNRTVTHKYDDNIVSGGHWLYMINRKLGQQAAADSVLVSVHGDMDIIENGSYYQMCRFYQGALQPGDLQPEGKRSSSDDVLMYGLGNWKLYHENDTAAAQQQYQQLLANGNPYSFAYLAAEADWKRLFE